MKWSFEKYLSLSYSWGFDKNFFSYLSFRENVEKRVMIEKRILKVNLVQVDSIPFLNSRNEKNDGAN